MIKLSSAPHLNLAKYPIHEVPYKQKAEYSGMSLCWGWNSITAVFISCMAHGKTSCRYLSVTLVLGSGGDNPCVPWCVFSVQSWKGQNCGSDSFLPCSARAASAAAWELHVSHGPVLDFKYCKWGNADQMTSSCTGKKYKKQASHFFFKQPKN